MLLLLLLLALSRSAVKIVWLQVHHWHVVKLGQVESWRRTFHQIAAWRICWNRFNNYFLPFCNFHSDSVIFALYLDPKIGVLNTKYGIILIIVKKLKDIISHIIYFISLIYVTPIYTKGQELHVFETFLVQYFDMPITKCLSILILILQPPLIGQT